MTYMADKIGKAGSNDGGDVGVRYATIAKQIKSGDLKHTVEFGLTKPKMLAAHTDSSSKFLMYDGRLNGNLKPVDRVMGLSYTVKAPLFTGYARISEAGADNGATDDENDLYVQLPR